MNLQEPEEPQLRLDKKDRPYRLPHRIGPRLRFGEGRGDGEGSNGLADPLFKVNEI